MFACLKKAGLTPPEFAVIVGVKRVSVYNWVSGRTTPHQLIAPRVKKALAFVEKLTALNKLPLKEGLDKEERKAKIVKLKEIFESNAA